MAGDCSIAALDFAADGPFAVGDTGEEVVGVGAAAVEADLGIGEEVFLGELGVGYGFAAAHEFEGATVDNDLAFGAIKEHGARDLCGRDRNAIVIGELGAEFSSGLFGWADFDRARVIHVEGPMGDIEVVCSEIAIAAAAVFGEGSPLGVIVVYAAWAEDSVIWPEWGRSEPAVPVESRFHRLLGQITGSWRTTEVALDTFDLADDAIAYQFAGDAKLRHGTLHGTGLQDSVVFFGLGHDHDSLSDIVGERFFAVDVLSGA